MKNISFLLFAVSISIYSFSQCTAGFTVNTSASPTISFTNTCSGAASPRYTWNFGDANTDQQANPSHVYAYSGIYTVTLTYSDTLNPGCSATFSNTVTVTNAPSAPCNPQFSFSVDSMGQVYFTDQSTYLPQQWNWNFGDGNTSTQQNPAHQYSVNGTYSVCLTIKNIMGTTCTFCDTVNSTPCWQKLNVTYTYSGNNPYSFTSNCSGASNPHYNWDFGDGNTSAQQNPSHSYKYNGIYTACLS